MLIGACSGGSIELWRYHCSFDVTTWTHLASLGRFACARVITSKGAVIRYFILQSSLRAVPLTGYNWFLREALCSLSSSLSLYYSHSVSSSSLPKHGSINILSYSSTAGCPFKEFHVESGNSYEDPRTRLLNARNMIAKELEEILEDFNFQLSVRS